MAAMTNLVMIPAFGCDERLYAEIAPLLPSNVLNSTVIADGADFATCVEQVLAQAPRPLSPGTATFTPPTVTTSCCRGVSPAP